MDIPRQIFTPEVIHFLQQKPAHTQAEQQRQHQHHDQCAERGVPQTVVVLAVEQGMQMPLQPRRRRPEVFPARCRRADKTPGSTNQHNGHGVIPQPAVPAIAFFGKEITTDKGQHQRPVTEPY
ncbi:hypothetical protein D3C72_1719020 [compost metagenome]